jgi:hypothetical protein
VQIQQDGQMQKALPGADEGAITHPDLIGDGDIELALHEIGSGRLSMVIFHDDSEATFASRLYPSLPPEAGYPVLAAYNSLHVEFTPSLHGTIGFAVDPMHFFDLPQQLPVLLDVL